MFPLTTAASTRPTSILQPLYRVFWAGCFILKILKGYGRFCGQILHPLSLPLSLPLYISVSVYISVSLPLSLSLYISVSLSVSPTLLLSLTLYFPPGPPWYYYWM